MGYHGNMKILLPWGVPIHHIFYSVLLLRVYGWSIVGIVSMHAPTTGAEGTVDLHRGREKTTCAFEVQAESAHMIATVS